MQLPPELAYDVLSVADMYLLPGLKQLPRHAGFPRGEHRGSRHRFL